MKQLLIMRPANLDFATAPVVSGGTGSANLLTPDPKEAWISNSAATVSARVKLSAAQTVDTAFIGFSDLPHGTLVRFYTYTTIDPAGELLLGSYTVDNPNGDTRPRHAFAQGVQRAGVTAIGVLIDQPSARAATVGVMSAGLSSAPFWGHDYGAGRFVTDTGTKERLFGGGFGRQIGARAGGYGWTFGELSETEVDDLYRIALEVGETGDVLVIENPDTIEAGLNERIHWGIFDRIEQYDRFAPGATRWAFKIQDWA